MKTLIAPFALVACLLAGTAFAQAPPEEAVDHVALASRLVADGHFDRARAVLGSVVEVPPAQLADYHVVQGLVALHEQRWQAAIDHLDAAIFAGKVDDLLFVYLAQATWGLQDYEATVRMIRNAGEHGAQSAPLQLVRIQSLWRLGRLYDAWRAAHHNMIAFGDEPQFRRMILFLLVELGLFVEAVDLAAEHFAAESAVFADDYIAFGQALLASGQTEAAVRFLERAHLQFPDDPRVGTQLARALWQGGLPIAAAELLQRVAVDDDVLLLESAEMFRRGAALDRALYMNAQVSDQRAKLRQRVGILTDRQDFEAVAAMEERLARVGLLDDQDVRYGVAYALFQIGDYDGAERLLRAVSEARLFESATQLRQVMAHCRKNPC